MAQLKTCSTRLLAGLTPKQQETLEGKGQVLGFSENDLILRSGERSRSFYLLLSGSVAVEVVRPSFCVCVQALEPGDAFEWSAGLEGRETLFQVRAQERCRVLCMDASVLVVLCQAQPELAVSFLRCVLRTVRARLKETETRLAEFCGSAERCGEWRDRDLVNPPSAPVSSATWSSPNFQRGPPRDLRYPSKRITAGLARKPAAEEDHLGGAADEIATDKHARGCGKRLR